MTLSLDASVLIDLANGRQPAVRARFDRAVFAAQSLVTCSLCAQELLFGASISRRPELQIQTARAVLAQVTVAEFNLDDAERAAQLRASLRTSGRSIGDMDSLIAGQALARRWTVVTSNLREFNRVPDLDVIDWRAAPESP